MGGRFWGGISSAQLSGFLTALIVITLLGLSSPAYAEEITYSGDGKKLQEGPAWFLKPLSGLLFPGTTGAPLSLNNKVTVNYTPGASGTENPVFVFGGLSETAAVEGNSVVFLNGSTNYIFGGDSDYGNVVDNAVMLGGGNAKNIIGGSSIEGAVTDNMVIISGGIVEEFAYGGFGHKGSVIGNSVTVKEGKVGYVYGGSSYGGAADNSVTISGGVVSASVFGGWGDNDGGATGNSVTISGGSVAEHVYGGRSRHRDVSGNTITISGGSVEGEVFGGLSHESNATNNSVTLSGRPNLTNARIYGGYSYKSPGDCFTGSADIIMSVSESHPIKDVFTGNTLNLKSFGISVASVGNFEYYNFDLPEGLAADTVMLSVITKEVFLRRRTIKISLQGGVDLKKGYKIALIHSAAGISGSPKNTSCKAQHGGALYDFSIYTDKNNLWAEVTKISKAK